MARDERVPRASGPPLWGRERARRKHGNGRQFSICDTSRARENSLQVAESTFFSPGKACNLPVNSPVIDTYSNRHPLRKVDKNEKQKSLSQLSHRSRLSVCNQIDESKDFDRQKRGNGSDVVARVERGVGELS